MSITSRVWGLSLAGLIAAAAPLASQAAEKKPEWIRFPGREALFGVWPRAAMERGAGGSARLNCVVTVQGGVRDCVVTKEYPAGGGFGAAALTLTPLFLLRPGTRDGVPVETRFDIPVRFEWDDRTATTFIRSGISARTPGLVREYAGPLAWSQAPSVADLVAAYPPKAREKKTGGRATLDCAFAADGRLTDCKTLVEEPVGMDFGQAAKLLAERFRGPTQDAQGQPMAGAHTQLAFAFPALARETDKPPTGKPLWTAIPKAQDLAAAMPTQAKAAGVLQADVMLQCSVDAGGALTGCVVESEAPGDLGYGHAALALSPLFHVSLWTEEGLPTIGGQLRLPLRFDYAASPPAKP